MVGEAVWNVVCDAVGVVVNVDVVVVEGIVVSTDVVEMWLKLISQEISFFQWICMYIYKKNSLTKHLAQ